nr:uncharacterized protein LOC105477847 isoform X2 [Macaca nemestrina]
MPGLGCRGCLGAGMHGSCRKKGNVFMFKKRKARNRKGRNCLSSWQESSSDAFCCISPILIHVRREETVAAGRRFKRRKVRNRKGRNCLSSWQESSSDAFCCISPILIHVRREETVARLQPHVSSKHRGTGGKEETSACLQAARASETPARTLTRRWRPLPGATLFVSRSRRVIRELAIRTDFHARTQWPSSPALCMAQTNKSGFHSFQRRG